MKYSNFFQFRATGKDRNWDGFHQRRHANSGESSQGNGIVLWNFPKVLEEVSFSIPKVTTKVCVHKKCCYFRGTEFKEDDAIWKNGEDGGAGGGGPPPQGMGAMGPTGGYVAK